MNVQTELELADRVRSGYGAARVVAKTVEAHFSRHLAAARARGDDGLAEQPDAQTIETIIDAAFWASLRHEEGTSPKISLAFLPPEQTVQPIIFAKSLPLLPPHVDQTGTRCRTPGNPPRGLV